MAMRIPGSDYEMRHADPGVTESEFHKRAKILEGVNGHDRMNTRFENTQRTQVLEPRGDGRGRPMPRDARFLEADNHGEWGQDTFHERLEFGMDGPNSTESYHGAGLPRRMDLSDPVNMNSHSEVGLAPTSDGVDGDS